MLALRFAERERQTIVLRHEGSLRANPLKLERRPEAADLRTVVLYCTLRWPNKFLKNKIVMFLRVTVTVLTVPVLFKPVSN